MLGRGADGLHAHGALHAVRVVDEVRHVELAADARQIEQLRLGFGFGFGFGFGLALGLGLANLGALLGCCKPSELAFGLASSHEAAELTCGGEGGV